MYDLKIFCQQSGFLQIFDIYLSGLANPEVTRTGNSKCSNIVLKKQKKSVLYLFQAPWSAAIWIKVHVTGECRHHCGGSIISKKYILTAAQ